MLPVFDAQLAEACEKKILVQEPTDSTRVCNAFGMAQAADMNGRKSVATH